MASRVEALGICVAHIGRPGILATGCLHEQAALDPFSLCGPDGGREVRLHRRGRMIQAAGPSIHGPEELTSRGLRARFIQTSVEALRDFAECRHKDRLLRTARRDVLTGHFSEAGSLRVKSAERSGQRIAAPAPLGVGIHGQGSVKLCRTEVTSAKLTVREALASPSPRQASGSMLKCCSTLVMSAKVMRRSLLASPKQ